MIGLMIAQNVQISDTVANAPVLDYFKSNLIYSLKKIFPLFCPVHLFDSYTFYYNTYVFIIRCVKISCRLHQYSLVTQRGITPLQVSF
jgi:hypothetical protein